MGLTTVQRDCAACDMEGLLTTNINILFSTAPVDPPLYKRYIYLCYSSGNNTEKKQNSQKSLGRWLIS